MTEWILTSSVLILLVIAVRGLFRNKMKAKYVYALWLIVLVRLLCPVNFGELSFNLLSLAEAGKAQIAERIGEEETSAQQETAVYEEWEAQKEFYESHGIMYVDPENPNVIVRYPVDSDDLAESYLPMEDAATAESPAVVESKSAAEETGFSLPEINWQEVLPYAWIAGMAVMLAVIFIVNISFSTTLRLLRKELPVLAKKGHGKKELAVYLADGIYSSCLYGVVHPSIYLNKEGMGEQEKTYCVEHEYSHYLQGDMVWVLCRTVCLILHWYNPLVWLAVMLSKKDAELACDERTIERLGEEERYNYGHTLVELAAGQSKAVQMFGMATLMASDKKEVADRVKAITKKKETKIITGLLVAVLVVGIGCFVFTGEAKGEQENNNITATPLPTGTVTVAPVPEETPEAEPTKMPAAATPTPEAEAIESFPAEGISIPNLLNVRCDAGYEYSVLDQIQVGTAVTILSVKQDEEGDDWYEVSLTQNERTVIGYVVSEYIATGAEMEDVRKMVANSGAGYVWVRTPGTNYYTREWGTFVKGEVTYDEISVVDHVEIALETGKGQQLDLDGDGTKELIYADPLRGVYINNKYALWVNFEDDDTYCLLDIDTTDGMYEILVYDTVYYYDGAKLQTSATFTRKNWIGGGYFISDINEFERIDEHAIAFSTYQKAHFGIVENQFCLDEEHQLVPTADNRLSHSHESESEERYGKKADYNAKVWCDFTMLSQPEYREIFFEDHVPLTENEQQGWLIDLNGDGTEEKLWVREGYLCVNGYGIELPQSTQTSVWLLDIDITDGMYELLTEDGALLYYDGKKLMQSWELWNYTFGDGCTFQGTLREFTRIDEHTISFENVVDQNHAHEINEVVYRLNRDHELVEVGE